MLKKIKKGLSWFSEFIGDFLYWGTAILMGFGTGLTAWLIVNDFY